MEYLRSYPLPYDLHLSLSFLFCLFCFVFPVLFFQDLISQCSPGCPASCSVDLAV